jgi:hypothetical protein
MYNDVDLFKKIVIYDQVKKKELINKNKEEIKSSKDALNTKINTNIESTVKGFNIHTKGLNNLTNFIYAKDICNLNSNKVRKPDGTKLSESELDSLSYKEKTKNQICCNNPDIAQTLKDNNFSCYSKESFANYKNIEKFSEDEKTGLIDADFEIKHLINTEDIPIPEPTETTLFDSKLLVSDFIDKSSKDGKTRYDGLSIPGDLKISKKNGANVHIDGKDTRLCGTGRGRMCSHFPYKNKHTYIRPGKKNSNIYVDYANLLNIKNNRNNLIGNNLNHIVSKRNDMCGTGRGRMCSHFPYSNNHTYIRPGKKNSNIYVDYANLLNIKNNRNNLIGNNLNHIVSKRNDMCGLGKGRMCSHFPYSNNHTYIRPGKRNSHNIYLTHAKHFRAEHNQSNDICGKGTGRLCSHFPYINGHTYIRPGNKNKNIYIGGEGKWNETNTTVIDSKNPVQIKSGIYIDNGKKLCIDNQCLTKYDIEKLKNL